ncbi:hypothetical protein VNO77_11655 [Canavalia gladiata]|uniref:Uncharacterized protein n=1 Tax=Canavalia gladiata TaxID=3824 RepID=A0AAN9MD46_CANGL
MYRRHLKSNSQATWQLDADNRNWEADSAWGYQSGLGRERERERGCSPFSIDLSLISFEGEAGASASAAFKAPTFTATTPKP